MKEVYLLVFVVVFSLRGFSQENYSFDRKKWADDTPDSLTVSYRGMITDDSHFFLMLKGKTKKQMLNLLGTPDSLNKKSFTTKRTIGYVYCIDKTTIDLGCQKRYNKCNPCKKSSITIIVIKGVVVDIIGMYSSG